MSGFGCDLRGMCEGLDRRGDHALVCSCGRDRVTRDKSFCKIVFQAASDKPGLLQRRPPPRPHFSSSRLKRELRGFGTLPSLLATGGWRGSSSHTCPGRRLLHHGVPQILSSRHCGVGWFLFSSAGSGGQ